MKYFNWFKRQPELRLMVSINLDLAEMIGDHS